MVVTGLVSRSGDWVDSVMYVCSPLHLISEQEVSRREIDDAQALAAAAAEAIANLGLLAGLGR